MRNENKINVFAYVHTIAVQLRELVREQQGET